VDEAENERDIAMEVNAKSVGNLAKLCEEMDAKLIHFSTDYVFDGESEEGYREDAQTNPINFYGKTKLEGEKAIEESGCEFALIRLSWLFGEGKNFVNTMLDLGRENKEVKVVEDQKGKPTYAKDLAQATKKIILENQSGIFHLPNEGETTWSEFAKKIFEIAKMSVKVIPIKSDEWKTLAKRPKNSTLLNTKLAKLRNWEEALREFLTSSK
jgi:dTDP-4-dehydrorhamnose reductase